MKLEILGEVVAKIDQQIKTYDGKMAPEHAQKIADAIAAHKKLTTEEIANLATEILAVISPLQTQTTELIKWQEDVKKEM